jgi:hypothetical protein
VARGRSGPACPANTAEFHRLPSVRDGPKDLARSLLRSGGVLRIELHDREDGTTTLELAGRVVGPWVRELSRSCERILAVGGTLSVDLSQVSFVDRDGLEVLQRLRARDVRLVNCSPFVAEQLKG